MKALLEVMAVSHSGMTAEEFEGIVKDWLATARHPRFQRPYNDVVYQPMLELLAYLRANGFKTFIVSGGGVEFMRAWVEKVYGIPPEQVVGSMGKQKFEWRDGRPVIVKLPAVDFVDDKEGKPIGIRKFIGQRPIFTFGNSDGDQHTLLRGPLPEAEPDSWGWSVAPMLSVSGRTTARRISGNWTRRWTRRMQKVGRWWI